MSIPDDIAEKYPPVAEMLNLYASRRDNPTFWDDNLFKSLKVIEASPNRMVWEFTVEEEHCNQLGNLHGGCVATVIDVCSSYSAPVYDGKNQWFFGVSVDLSISYLRAISAGQKARVECEVQRVGKNLSNLYTKIYDEEGNLCYTGSHTKFPIENSRL